MESDGELEALDAAAVRTHLKKCAECRRRQMEILEALGAVSEHHFAQPLPPIESARASLVSRLRPSHTQRYLAVGALAAALLLLVWHWAPERANYELPLAALTPGAVNPAFACAAETERPPIPNAVAMEVFRRYGIHNPQPRTYEVDYLIPPDLGGSGDPHNLWPQPYNAGIWTARVKDALEDRLRTMVCEGSISLAVAQEEIASDWIGAYRKHFHTHEPLPDHVAFVKDQPWE